jgi:hypothetical protein
MWFLEYVHKQHPSLHCYSARRVLIHHTYNQHGEKKDRCLRYTCASCDTAIHLSYLITKTQTQETQKNTATEKLLNPPL